MSFKTFYSGSLFKDITLLFCQVSYNRLDSDNKTSNQSFEDSLINSSDASLEVSCDGLLEEKEPTPTKPSEEQEHPGSVWQDNQFFRSKLVTVTLKLLQKETQEKNTYLTERKPDKKHFFCFDAWKALYFCPKTPARESNSFIKANNSSSYSAFQYVQSSVMVIHDLQQWATRI